MRNIPIVTVTVEGKYQDKHGFVQHFITRIVSIIEPKVAAILSQFGVRIDNPSFQIDRARCSEMN